MRLVRGRGSCSPSVFALARPDRRADVHTQAGRRRSRIVAGCATMLRSKIVRSRPNDGSGSNSRGGAGGCGAGIDSGVDGIIGSGHAADKRFDLFFYGRSVNAHTDPSVSETKQLHGSVSETER